MLRLPLSTKAVSVVCYLVDAAGPVGARSATVRRHGDMKEAGAREDRPGLAGERHNITQLTVNRCPERGIAASAVVVESRVGVCRRAAVVSGRLPSSPNRG